MLEFIYEWAQKVNKRTDLLPAWRERKMNVILQVGNHILYLFIDHSGVHFKTDHEGKGHIHLQSSATIMESLFTGRRKLTALPESMIKVQGAYRNVLFIESLLLLAK